MARARRCTDCGDKLAADAHPARKYCEPCRPAKKRGGMVALADMTVDDLRGEPREVPGYEGEYVGPISEQLEVSIAAAGDKITPADQALVQAARFLAKKIDTEDLVRDRVLTLSAEAGEKPPNLPMDNVSVPTFLKYLDALGLSPAGRVRIEGQKKEDAARGGKATKLSVLRAEEGA